MISKNIIFTLILILLFLGAVYATQKRLEIPIYSGSLHPNNTDKYGTSNFIELLDSLGYRVSTGDIDDIYSDEYELYILIGPDIEISDVEANQLLDYVSKGGNILIASEFDDIVNILKIFNIYPSNMIKFMEPNVLIDPFIEVSCTPCPSFDTISLDLPNSFIIAATYNELNNRFTILDKGLDYIQYKFFTDRVNFTALATGRIINLENEFKASYIESIYQGRSITESIFSLDLIEYSVENGVLLTDIGFLTNQYTLIFIEVEGGGRVVFITDTSPFINIYVEKDSSTPLLMDILEYLLPDGGDILIDIEHYEIISANVTLPHIGRILLTSLQTYISEFEEGYTDYLSQNSLFLIGIISIFGLSLFISLRRYLKIEDEAGLAGEDVVEKEIIIFTDALIPIRDIYGRNFREFIINTYNFTSLMLSELYGLSIKDVLDRKIDIDENIYQSVKYIDSIYKRVKRRFIFPPILYRKGVIRRLLQSIDTIMSGVT